MNGPVLDGRSVFFTTMDGAVYHLDQRTGRQRWRRTLRATSAPWLNGDEVHVTARDGEREERTVVLSRARGETLRHFDPVVAPFLHARADHGGVRAGWAYEGSRPTVVGERSYQTIGNEVHCRDVGTGDLLWRRQYSERTDTRPASPPAVAGGQLVFGTREGQLFALDVDTGLTAWAYDVGEPIAAQPTIAHGWVYAATASSGLVALEVSDPSFDGWHMWGGSAGHNGPTLGTTPPIEDTGRPTEGTLRLGEEPNLGELGGFPIERTQVQVRITGVVAHVQVTQTFSNPYGRPVEAQYLFPVPEGAVISGMRMRAGERVVRAEIRALPAHAPDADATEDEELTTSVLVQERADLYRQTVRNVRPSESVQVVLEYTQVLSYAEGAYRFDYPLAAGPRYERADGNGFNAAGTPVERELSPGDERPDHVAVVVEAETGGGGGLTSSSHELDLSRASARVTRAELSGPAHVDRDLELRIELAEDEPSATLVASPPTGDEAGYFALALHPRLDVGEAVMPRELVLVLDRSTSMRGAAMEIARATALRSLASLRPPDTFRVLTLDGSTAGLGEHALAATPANVARAEHVVRRLSTIGTGRRDGLSAALEAPTGDERLRVVVLVSDGYLGNERDVFAEVRERIGEARLFALGVGTAVNQYLLTRLVELGRGELVMASPGDAPTEVAAAFDGHVARPHLTDLSVSFDGLAVADVFPRRLPDVYAVRPVVLHGRFAEGGDGQITVRGRLAGRPFEQVLDVTLPEAGPERPELATVWAQTRIRDAMTSMALTPDPRLRGEVTRLGMEHRLLTPYTTFVAVDPGDPREHVVEGASAPEDPLPSTRPEREASAYVGPCFAQARDDEGVVDQARLAACLADARAAP